MARRFDDASSQYLTVSSIPVTSTPLTIACWFYMVAASELSVSCYEIGSPNHGFFLQPYNDSTVYATAIGGSGSGSASQTSISLNTWHHAAATFASASSRTAWLDGSAGTANTTNVGTLNTLDTMEIGGSSAFSEYGDGRMCEVGIWDVELTSVEISDLADGVSPLAIRENSLIFYAPLVRDEDQDEVGGLSFTATNTPTVEDHMPDIIMPFSSGQLPGPFPLDPSIAVLRRRRSFNWSIL